MAADPGTQTTNNYARYAAAAYNRPEHYPIGQQLDMALYRPMGKWMGRLVLPSLHERAAVLGTWIDLWHAPEEYAGLVGARARLRWESTLDLNARLWGATCNVIFDENALTAARGGAVLAERLNGLPNVNPFESLAGAHPYDDVFVRLDGSVRVEPRPPDGLGPILWVSTAPIEISGPFYGLVRFIGPAGDGERCRVRHYHAAAHDFSGPEEIMLMPEVVPDGNDTRNSTAAQIEASPCNPEGWYVYGMQDREGCFVVRAMAARQLLRLAPEAIVAGTGSAMSYLGPKAWRRAVVKGAATQALLVPDGIDPDVARAGWRVGDKALLIHLFGGIGGNKTEPVARTPLYWGHFAFGVAEVIHEPLADEPSFDIVYHQVYVHNVDGTIAGATHYSRYSGDRQFGWAGVRPIQDILLKLDALCGPFTIFDQAMTALEQIVRQLEVMEARYRIADGRGATAVGAANNCAQDSAQALYAAVMTVSSLVAARPDVRAEMQDTPEEARRLEALAKLGDELRRVLLPWGSARADWEYGLPVLSGAAGSIISTIGKAARSWRTMLPPVAARALAEAFLKHGATAYVLRTFQVGGHDPDIEPIVPNI